MAMGSPTRDRRQALADHGIALHGIALGKRRIIKDRPAPVVTAREQYFFYAENRNRQRDPRLSTLENKWRFKLPSAVASRTSLNKRSRRFCRLTARTEFTFRTNGSIVTGLHDQHLTHRART
jgi:hypothetical protein